MVKGRPLTSHVDRVILLLVAGALLLLRSVLAPPATFADERGDHYRVRTLRLDKGVSIDEVVIAGPPEPPVGIERLKVEAADLDAVAAAVLLPDVPAFNWSFGCSATSGAMMAGYYDRNGLPAMYTGPTNGGVMPLDNSPWPDVVINGEARHQCPLSATRLGLDGRTERGHVDDYWIRYLEPGPDPFVYNGWQEQPPADCTADFMKTNKWFGSEGQDFNVDGSTVFYFWPGGSRMTATNMELLGIDAYDGGYGLKLFFESRGYTVADMYNQYISGFTFADYQAEIDAGSPVLLHVEGHTMLGLGYDAAVDRVYLHDTWDYDLHWMDWGGSYAGMDQVGVTVVQLAQPECLGDLDADGDIDVADIQMVVNRWGCLSSDPCYDGAFDLDGDGDVDLIDVMTVAARWGMTC